MNPTPKQEDKRRDCPQCGDKASHDGCGRCKGTGTVDKYTGEEVHARNGEKMALRIAGWISVHLPNASIEDLTQFTGEQWNAIVWKVDGKDKTPSSETIVRVLMHLGKFKKENAHAKADAFPE